MSKLTGSPGRPENPGIPVTPLLREWETDSDSVILQLSQEIY